MYQEMTYEMLVFTVLRSVTIYPNLDVHTLQINGANCKLRAQMVANDASRYSFTLATGY